jgi:hypothetical protein
MEVFLKTCMLTFKFILRGSEVIGHEIDAHETKHMNVQQIKI